MQLHDVAKNPLEKLSDDGLRELLLKAVDLQRADRQENQILYYQPVSSRAMSVHECEARIIGVGGGNGSSKTSTALVEAIACATGVFPISLQHLAEAKWRGPIQCRVVCESLTTVLHPVILPKLQWWRWSGTDQPGGDRGHWGWIPKTSLIDGDWQKSWSEKLRTLRLICRDPMTQKMVGESTIQMMCLRGDQRVRMADSTWRPISEVREGEQVMRPNGETTRVVRTYRYADAPLLRVRCRGGREIVATPNHRHPLINGRTVQTSELTVGDVIRTNRDLSGLGAATLEDWALGWVAIMIGDGCIKFLQARFTAKEPSRVLNDLPPLPPNTKLKRGHGWDWAVTLIKGRRGNPLVVLLKKMGLWGKGSKDKFVPEEIFRQPIRGRAFFLRHLWNTDGTVNRRGRQASYRTISRRLAYDVKYLLWSLGIPASVGEVKGRCGFTGKTITSFHAVVSGGGFDRFIAAMAGKDFEEIDAATRKGECGEITAISDAGRDAVYCIEVDATDRLFIVDGIATHNSVDQDPSDFASGDFHLVLHDEPPSLAIWRENEARTMRTAGRMLLAMTWPDDPSIAVDWIFNEVYEPGLNPHEKRVKWFTLSTFDNKNLRQLEVHEQAQAWSEEVRKVRIEGQPLRFSNRIHPDFTDFTKTWCFTCDKSVIPTSGGPKICPNCNSPDIEEYNHVEDFSESGLWPTIFLLDPHPRKPHMMMWVQIDPSDDLWQVAEASVEGEPSDVKAVADRIEGDMKLFVAQRIMDPNMGASPSGTKREISWQDEFRSAGLSCDLADDSEVGRKRLNGYMRPDKATRRPRIHIHKRCKDTVYQINRYVWDDFKRGMEKDLKQTPKAKYDDMPTLLKYCMNSEPQFNLLKYGAPVFRRQGTRRGAY